MTTLLFGIHLGNSSGCVGIFKDGKADVLASDSGERIIPAVVSYRNNNEKVVGMAAKSGMARFGTCTVTNNKRLMNMSISDKELSEAISRTTCKVVPNDDGVHYEVEYEGKTTRRTPDQVHTQLYRKLHETASSSLHTGESTLPAVLTVPVHFCSASRKEVMRAAEEAGFKVLQLIDEPSASLLAHNVGQVDLNEEGYVVVYRVGGATLDVTVFWINSGMYTLVTNVHQHNIGGHIITEELAKFLAKEFHQKVKLDPMENRRSMAKLRGAAETCKHVLSTMQTAHCFTESLVDGVDLSSNISRARFESILNPLLPQFLEPVSKAIESAGITAKDVKKVVVAGGTLKIPRLQQALSGVVPDAEVLGLGPAISPDEVIAMGAAVQASCVPQGWDGDCIQLSEDVSAISQDVVYQVDGSEKKELIAMASCPVPFRKQFVITVPEGCDKMKLSVSQGSRCLGQACLDGESAGSTVNFEVSVGREGEVHVTLADQKLQKRVSVHFESVSL
ncbi:heat shock 70 kDa protein 14-like [Frankliniella occidentalis]|uniref:Heat shock 70 kDa protein 14-like n=1 Tax=Frankliniella occidentalis TaxID=133901 RepID=A0A6J1RXT1_FRAOC|nr:heat shock 70 kDa protein 14-like [Frankliniella occidentalis]